MILVQVHHPETRDPSSHLARRENELMPTASLNLDGKSYELPVIRGTENETAVDISKLLGQSAKVTY